MAKVLLVTATLLASVCAQSDPVPCCPQGEVYNDCLSSCGDGCDNIFTTKICTLECRPPGCVCAEELSRDPRYGTCTDKCPTPDIWDYASNKPRVDCGACNTKQESFRLYNRCIEKCPGPDSTEKCALGPKYDSKGCYCQNGLCRNAHNECVTDPRGYGVYKPDLRKLE